MKFVMPRNRVVSGFGHAVEFAKNEPTHVPPDLYEQVMAAGGVPETELNLDPPAPPGGPTEPRDPIEREKAIFSAFEKLVLANRRGDFTAGGVPHPAALRNTLGWDLPNKERDILWVKFRSATKG